MPALLEIKNITIKAPHKILCDWIHFSLNAWEKVALTARNWAWKSSLLKVIAWKEEAYEGSISIHSQTTIWYLSQEDTFSEHATVLDSLFSHQSEQWKVIQEYELALLVWADNLPELVEKIEELQAWDYETKVRIVIEKLRLSTLLEKKVQECSWGELKRLSLAKLLIEDPELLILDEPTNHLDMDMIERLETYLRRSKRTLLLVTHDRYFLERLCSRIVELSWWRLYSYPWNYSRFLELKQKREDDEGRQLHRAKQVLRKELEWIKKAPRARENKSSYRTKKFYAVEGEYKALKSTQYHKQKTLDISLEKRRIWWKILRLYNVHKAFWTKKILDNFSYDFKAWERVWLIGKNWVGKSTFLNILLGQESIDSWDIRRWDTIHMAMYQQKQVKLDESKKILDVVRDKAEYITIWDGDRLSASQLLDKFLFPPKQQHQKAYTLSWGERRRLHLLCILITNPNFLILDEPTNDLDIETLQILEDFLLAYTWCLVIVSHDRFFMDKVVDHLLVFDGWGKVKEFPWNYSDWLHQESAIEEQTIPVERTILDSSSVVEENVIAKKKSLSNKEREEYKMLSSEIERLEIRKEEINLTLSSWNLSHTEIKELSLELWKTHQSLVTYEERWFELEERV